MKYTPNAARLYVKRIRNAKKRRYAGEYLDYLNGYLADEPPHDLTFMGAQSVRLALHAIYQETEA